MQSLDFEGDKLGFVAALGSPNWKRRFFVLQGTNVSYYSKQVLFILFLPFVLFFLMKIKKRFLT